MRRRPASTRGCGLTRQRCAPRVDGAGSRHVVRGPTARRAGSEDVTVIIGIDPHTRTHTASALGPATHRVLASLQVDATLAGYRQLLRWATRFEARRWAVENARGLGRHLAQWLVAREEQVEDVPCTATARVRELSRGGRRKNGVNRRRRRGERGRAGRGCPTHHR
ncbi:IS110 family transposase [Pseudonocardia sp. D17]|uniref:IS110 family transposase n=1 Tax=Pseudonocardia sp. D17 TaxID=882661 RepID=UPI0030D240D8